MLFSTLPDSNGIPLFLEKGNPLFLDEFPEFKDSNEEEIEKQVNTELDEKLGNLYCANDNNANLKNEKKPKQIKSNNVKFLTKKRKKSGRKAKNSTEKGKHTSESSDNIRDNNWRDFFDHIKNSFNNYIEQQYSGLVSPTLHNTNIKKQLGSSNVKQKQFIKNKIYKVLIYNPPPDNKYKYHRDFGSNNEIIIRDLVINKKDELFTALMKLDIESIHNIFIQNKKKINIKGKEYDLSDFKLLNDYIIEKINLLNNKTDTEIKNEIFLYKNKFTNLIQYIKEEGKNRAKTKELKEKDIVIYRTIEELEEE